MTMIAASRYFIASATQTCRHLQLEVYRRHIDFARQRGTQELINKIGDLRYNSGDREII